HACSVAVHSWRHRVTDENSVLLQRLDLDAQTHLADFTLAVLAHFHSVLRPVELAFGVGAAQLLLQYGMRYAVEEVDGEIRRTRDSHDRDLALDGPRLVAGEFKPAFVSRRGILRDIEEIAGARFFVHRVQAKIDARGVDHDVHGSRLGGAVDGDVTGRFVELAAPNRDAEVGELDARIRVIRVDPVLVGGGERRRGTRNESGDNQFLFEHATAPSGEIICGPAETGIPSGRLFTSPPDGPRAKERVGGFVRPEKFPFSRAHPSAVGSAFQAITGSENPPYQRETGREESERHREADSDADVRRCIEAP